jgi:hypothetical protein
VVPSWLGWDDLTVRLADSSRWDFALALDQPHAATPGSYKRGRSLLQRQRCRRDG